MTGVLLDITDRKLAEEERSQLLEREQKARLLAEQANRLKDEFLATVSHELRTPLTAILGWARILHARRHEPESVARAIETIERNAKGLAQIVEDILDVSRIITGKLRVEFGPVDLMNVAMAAVDVVRPTAEAKGVVLEPAPSGPPCVVWGDPDRLQQVVWNLLSNAVKFTPRGGHVSVTLERASTHARVCVTDTGQGIGPDFLPHLFERFRQADSTTTRSHGGLGLGLAIVRHLVELHGGAVVAESAGVGHGARFTITLPIEPELVERSEGMATLPPPSRAPEPVAPAALKGMKVLAVDDEADARELVVMVLEKEGAEVTVVATASEALARLREMRPNVLVSDISMPDEDGYALIRRVRALPEEGGGRTPSVALTAYSREEDRRKALGAGFDLHIPKPIDPARLVEAIARLCGRLS
jgi:CheY-like chemotaxis protein/nitrogen-specific signal transduction histidine kinase